mmetsp:Transcript_4327/g.5968  ORF Transcript_4327/g.5968 Transcript_4327/m.5968 type:complete len:487 (+) Transcript_4327:127-1587(+)
MSWITKDILKPIADTNNFDELHPDVFFFLSRAIEFHIKDIIQEAKKVRSHTKRRKLCTEDVNTALQIRNLECIYGHSSSKEILKIPPPNEGQDSNQIVGVGGDQVVDLFRAVEAPLPRLPLVPSYALHWLAVDGSQPGLPQNPSRLPPTGKSTPKRKKPPGMAKSESVDGGPVVERKVVAHSLSAELQAYYKRCIAVIGGEDEAGRASALSSLASDAGLQELLPYLTRFIAREVTKNLNNLSRLSALMAMVKAILQNPHFHPELYLHQMMPAVLTCLLGKGLCAHPSEDHWGLRDRSAQIAAYICRKFGEVYESLPPRVSKTLFEALADENKPLSTHYGAIVGLTALGPLSVEQLILPHLGDYTQKLGKRKRATEKQTKPGCKSSITLEINQCSRALQDAAGHYMQSLAKDFANSKMKSHRVRFPKRKSGKGAVKMEMEKNESKVKNSSESQYFAEQMMGIYSEGLIPYYLAGANNFPSTRADCFI